MMFTSFRMCCGRPSAGRRSVVVGRRRHCRQSAGRPAVRGEPRPRAAERGGRAVSGERRGEGVLDTLDHSTVL